jgi:S1-C subfamily serine protease
MEYFILKGHDNTGPFSEEELRREFAGRRLEAHDLARPAGERHWMPLRKLLEKLDEADAPEPAPAPASAAAPRPSHAVRAGGWVPVPRAPGLWALIEASPLRAGIAGVALAALLAFLARWPLLVALPGLALGVTAGLLLVMRYRPLAGAIVSLAAILLPLLLAPRGHQPVTDGHEIAAIPPATAAAPAISQPLPLAANTAPEPALESTRPPLLPVHPPASPAPAEEPLESPPSPPPATRIGTVIPDLPPVVEKPTPRVEKRVPAPDAPGTPPPQRFEFGKMVTSIVDKLTPGPKAPPAPPLPEPGPPADPSSTVPSLPKVVPPPGAARPSRPDDLVFMVDTGAGRGSGFLAMDEGQIYFFTNLHVVSAAKKITARSVLTTLDFKDGNIEVAADRDLVRLPVAMQAALQFGETPKIEDPVIALGNSGGREVVTRLEGRVLGIGPAQIEVTSEFIPGNSGGPLLDRDNRVIGVATYLLRGESVPDWIKAGTRFSSTRRFGVRVTEDVQWEPMTLAMLLRQTTLLQAGEETFSQYIGAIKVISEHPLAQPLAATLSQRADMRIFVDDYNRACRDMAARKGNNVNKSDFVARMRDNVGKLGRCIRSTAQGLRRDLGAGSKGYVKKEEIDLLEAYEKLATAIEKDERDLFHL